MIVGLGDRVKDRITGFSGIAIIRHTYLYANPRITVQPECEDDGFMKPSDTFEEASLEIINAWNEVLNYWSE